MPIQDTDNLIVGRGSDTFKIEYGQVKSDITSGVSGYVKLDDDGTKQVIESGGLGISDGTDENITLNADGSATFAGAVDIGDFDSSSAGVKAHQSGFVHVRKDGGTNAIAVWDGAGGTPTAGINPDGSATFAGNVGIGTTSANHNLTVSSGTNPIIAVQNSGQSTEGVFNAPSGGVINLGTTGSYALTLSTNSVERVRVDSSGDMFIGGDPNLSRNISLKADGSATFAGNVGITGKSGSNTAFYIWDAGNANATTVGINANGSATFAGNVYGATYFQVENGSTNNGRVSLSGSTDRAIQVTPDKTDTSFRSVEIDWDGSATFAGTVTIGNTPDAILQSTRETDVAGNALFLLSSTYNGRGLKFKVTADGNVYSKGNMSTPLAAFGDNITIYTEPDDPANYTTTMVDGEEQQVYNGPTLDVKEKVLNLISRLDAIEANEMIDDATDTSLLQLLASASARLDSIEARLSALEGGN